MTDGSSRQVPAFGVLLPLAAGYFMSYLFRNAYGVLAGDVMRDLGIGADGLGQITSVYFLVFAAAQFPIGTLLDRYGPRRVQGSLMMCAAVGAAVCWAVPGFGGALVGRLLIGLGTAGSLVAGLKGVASLYPREQHAIANGLFIMCGGLGALAATWPIEAALGVLTWRELFGVLAAMALSVSLVTSVLAPGPGARNATPSHIGLREIVANPLFYRFAPLSACCFGTVLAVQGLWAGPWLTDVDGLSRGQSASALGYMAVALVLAGLLWGVATRWLQRRTSLRHVMAGAALLLIATEVLIVAAPLRLPLVPWCLFGLFGGMSVLSFTILAQRFPPEVVGRANGALNTLHIGWSFVVQLGIGQVVALWPVTDGHYPATGYQTALTLAIICQAGALAWFVLPDKRGLWPGAAVGAQGATTVERSSRNPRDQGSAA